MDSMFAAAKLDEAQMAALGHCAGASLKQYGAGQTLIRVGERDFKFFVVRSGEIENVSDTHRTLGDLAVSPQMMASPDHTVRAVNADSKRTTAARCKGPGSYSTGAVASRPRKLV